MGCEVYGIPPVRGLCTLWLQIAQSRYYLQTLDPKVGTVCILGALGACIDKKYVCVYDISHVLLKQGVHAARKFIKGSSSARSSEVAARASPHLEAYCYYGSGTVNSCPWSLAQCLIRKLVRIACWSRDLTIPFLYGLQCVISI